MAAQKLLNTAGEVPLSPTATPVSVEAAPPYSASNSAATSSEAPSQQDEHPAPLVDADSCKIDEATEKLKQSLSSFTLDSGSNSSVNSNEKILEQLSPSGDTTGFTTPLLTNRRLSIGTNAVIPTLLNAQLNNLDIFNVEHERPPRPGHEDSNLDPSRLCLEHKLASISTALMTKKQLGKVIGGIRDLEQLLNRVNIRSKITHVMVITKLYDPEPVVWTSKVCKFLLQYSKDIKVYIQEELREIPAFGYGTFKKLDSDCSSRMRFWHGDRCSYRPEMFDLVLTFGGDGTVLYASWLFQNVIPPVLPFSLGSLGFLTEFNVKEHKEVLINIMENGYQCSIRMRFECTVMKSNHNDDIKADLREEVRKLGTDSKTHTISDTFTVFNEVVVDRGPNSMMTSLEVFGDREALTTAEADGLIISTPSGSTAYSLSAGGSLVHPEIPGILISPICPHTLSFRPLVIPESIILRLGVPYDARSTAWCAFDGKNRVELCKGDFMTITASRFPLACIRKPGATRNAWFERLSTTLNWNERKHQKPFNKP